MAHRTQNVFISYAHEDESFRDELVKHLSVLRQQGLISDWHDRQIRAGQAWEAEIEKNIKIADVILLLVSPDFLSSHFCYSVELKLATDLLETRSGVKVIPIILRPCDWEHSPVARFQVLPTDGIPITLWKTKDDAFTSVIKGLRSVLSKEVGASPPAKEAVIQQSDMTDLIRHARHGFPDDVDVIMNRIDSAEDEREQRFLQFVLSCVELPSGMDRIKEYLTKGTVAQTRAANLYFKTMFANWYSANVVAAGG